MSAMRQSAGLSSQRKYDALLKSWRRRNHRLFTIVTLICAAVLIGSLVAAEVWPRSAWIFGAFGGAAMSFWVVAHISPPGWIEHWQAGAWGEQATAKALRELERAGWVVIHDLPAGRGNVDHIVIGPAGVFLLDSKRLGGVVTVDAKGVTVRRPDDPDLSYQHPGTPYLLRMARATHDRVLMQTRIGIWVAPVMVLWSEFPQRIVEGRCAYVHGDALVAWLRSRPQSIAPHRIPQVAEAIRTAWPETDTHPA